MALRRQLSLIRWQQRHLHIPRSVCPVNDPSAGHGRLLADQAGSHTPLFRQSHFGRCSCDPADNFVRPARSDSWRLVENHRQAERCGPPATVGW